MRNDPASIGRTIAVSAVAHVLLFGTALAFAHYGAGLISSARPVIFLSLVGDDVHRAGPSAPAKRLQNSMPAAALPDPSRSTAPDPASVTPTEPDGQASGEIQREHQQREGGREEGNAAPNGAGQGSAQQQEDRPDGSPFGYSSADWQLLQTSLERVKSYPRLARERGIEGTVLVRFRASPSGRVEQVDIVKSSGARILDEASITTVYRASPVPYVNGWVEVPLVYQLRKEEGK